VSQDPGFVLDSCGNLDGELTLVVTDNTHFVRDDPEGLMSRTYCPWTVKTADDEDCASGLDDLFAACGCATGGGTGAILPSWAALGLLLARRRRT
jgi:MYXO-CTERM domain-containing protein